MDANNPPDNPAADAAPPAARAFSPLLVVLTVAVVVFVLWFCPKALRWAYDGGTDAPAAAPAAE